MSYLNGERRRQRRRAAAAVVVVPLCRYKIDAFMEKRRILMDRSCRKVARITEHGINEIWVYMLLLLLSLLIFQ